MRIPFRRRPTTRSLARGATPWFLTFTSLASLSCAITFTPVTTADLDLSQLGRVGIAGDFNAISLYEFEGQTESSFVTNGSSSLMTRLPNGMFLDLADADASIQTMCTFGGLVILGGNFTSLGNSSGKESPGIAAYNLTTSSPVPLAGLSGQVNSLLCDDDAGTVYVGGNFKALNSTNAITWIADNSWASLPFAGFNGPVTSITKTSGGHIVFGGAFTGLGNTSTPSQADAQVINLSTATIVADQGTTTSGFSDPKNIICKTGGVDGSGNTWLLEDNTAGAWQATFKFGFQPTKLRLWNTHQDGRGTKTWRFTALPINGIMNFTYTDPTTEQNTTCTSECPLSDDTSVKYQDFYFVNNVGMNEFKIDVSAWYGNGGGLDGIELFQDDIFVYAITDFNEPSCAGLSFPSNATRTGPWTVTPSGTSTSEYLSASLSSPITSDAAVVVFYPDIKESGNYSVVLYTPGCIGDDSCSRRGQVEVSWTLTAGGETGTTTLYQTNNYDKYDWLATGDVDASSDSFRPSVTISPLAGQSLTNLTMVAQRVGFSLITSSGGLNGLYEYDPTKATVDTTDFTTSAFDKLGSDFTSQSAVSSLVTVGDLTYIGGNFTSSSVRNIVAVNSKDNSTVALDGGLNGQIFSMYVLEDQLFVAGSFNNTEDTSATGLSNVAVYDTENKQWSALGAGVDAPVMTIVPMTLNISSSTPEDVITFTGDFKRILAFGSNDEISVDGFAIWVKSQSNWLQNLDGSVPSVNGFLSAALLNLSDGVSLYAGSISAQALSANGAVTIGDTLGTFPVDILSQSASTTNSTSGSSITKRSSLTNGTTTTSGVVAGVFYESGDSNITVLAGHFSATATDGTTTNNLVLIDGANNNNVTGLPAGISDESVFLALAIHGSTLFAGGQVNGTVGSSSVHCIISYSLADKKFNKQPPSLTGAKGVVSSINVRPNTAEVYAGGSFNLAGSLGCPGVCVFSTSLSQWNRPGVGLDGDVNCMMWSSDSTLIVGGNLTVNDTTTYLASFDADKSSWSSLSGTSSPPGPVDALTTANGEGSQLWVAGTQADGSVYLMKYDGKSWISAGVTFGTATVISSLQMFSLSSPHDSTDLVDSDHVLMITGSLEIPGFGTASSATFNGTTIQPYALTDKADNTAGSIAKIFVQNSNFFNSSDGHLALGFVVLIALAISLGLMLLIVVAGLALDRYRKKRDGYVPAPTSMYDRGSGMQRIPPHELLDSLSKGRPGAPHV